LSGLLHAPGHFILGGKARDILWIGGWVVPGAGVEKVDKKEVSFVPGLELGSLDCLAFSNSLYRLLGIEHVG
jgi:hypothetical protein